MFGQMQAWVDSIPNPKNLLHFKPSHVWVCVCVCKHTMSVPAPQGFCAEHRVHKTVFFKYP